MVFMRKILLGWALAGGVTGASMVAAPQAQAAEHVYFPVTEAFPTFEAADAVRAHGLQRYAISFFVDGPSGPGFYIRR
jgi:hypothetical protein